MNAPESRTQHKIKIFLLLVLIGTVVWIYWPSFYHLPRCDQYSFLIDSAHVQDLLPLLTKFYSYGRSRIYSPGDFLYFRPIFFIFLCLKKWAFGTNFVAPQVLGVILHLLVCMLLMNLMEKINKWSAAGMAAADSQAAFSFNTLIFVSVFATMVNSVDMVVWSHINGYLIFIVGALIAVSSALDYLGDPTRRKESFLRLLGGLGLAAFSHELGVIMAVECLLFILFVGYLQRKAGWFDNRAVLGIVGLVVLYFLLDAADYFHWKSVMPKVHSDVSTVVFGMGRLWDFIRYSVLLPFGLILAGLFPSVYRIFHGQRFGYNISIEMNPPTIFNVVLAAFMLIWFIQSVSRDSVKKRWPLCLFFLATVFFVTELLVLGRVLERGLGYVFQSATYYTYMVWIFFILALYSLVDLEKRRPRWLDVAGGVSLVLFVSWNAKMTYSLNLDYAHRMQADRDLLVDINSFVKQHRNEPDFSFRINPATRARHDHLIPIETAEGAGQIHLVDIFFSDYMRGPDSKYTLDMVGDLQPPQNDGAKGSGNR